MAVCWFLVASPSVFVAVRRGLVASRNIEMIKNTAALNKSLRFLFNYLFVLI